MHGDPGWTKTLAVGDDVYFTRQSRSDDPEQYKQAKVARLTKAQVVVVTDSGAEHRFNNYRSNYEGCEVGRSNSLYYTRIYPSSPENAQWLIDRADQLRKARDLADMRAMVASALANCDDTTALKRARQILVESAS